jgi:hypothetical protein
MKRSEAVQLAQKYLDHNAGQLVGEQLVRFAESILEMKPPRLPEEDCQAIMHVYYAGYTFYQWEEDAAKDEKVQEAKDRRRVARENRNRKADRGSD